MIRTVWLDPVSGDTIPRFPVSAQHSAGDLVIGFAEPSKNVHCSVLRERHNERNSRCRTGRGALGDKADAVGRGARILRALLRHTFDLKSRAAEIRSANIRDCR